MKNYLILLSSFILVTISYAQKPCPGIPTVTYEGKTYHTVQIGSQCWLKESLDVGTMIKGNEDAEDNHKIEKYCYNDSLANCEKYGGLYKWNEAMQYSTSEKVQGICPQGWHIPAEKEFDTLQAFEKNNGNALKAKGQGIETGIGTDESGFSVLISGCQASNGSFREFNSSAYLWSSTEGIRSMAYGMYIYAKDTDINVGKLLKKFGNCVRCIKD